MKKTRQFHEVKRKKFFLFEDRKIPDSLIRYEMKEPVYEEMKKVLSVKLSELKKE